MFRDNEEVFCKALEKDLRKPRWESVVSETDYCINDVQGMLDEIEEWVKPAKVKKPAVNALDQCIIKPDPYGVVLVMGAWNYPLNLSMGPVIGAIAAGNCVVLKPSELSHILPMLYYNSYQNMLILNVTKLFVEECPKQQPFLR